MNFWQEIEAKVDDEDNNADNNDDDDNLDDYNEDDDNNELKYDLR